MSLNFEAEQFEKEFTGSRLRNWEVPHWYPQRPCPRTGCTKIISNDRGHLLPGIHRPPRSPWGNFVSTWKLPSRIDRQLAGVLSGPDPGKKEKWIARCIHPSVIPAPCYASDGQPDSEQKKETVAAEQHPSVEAKPAQTVLRKTSPKLDINPDEATALKELAADEEYKQKLTEKSGFRTYIPGDLTDPKLRDPGYAMLNKLRPKTALPEIKNNQTYCKRHSGQNEQTPPEVIPPELADAICNFQTAKQFHRENLEHHPLPDTVTDAMYRKLQIQRLRNPGLALPDEACVTGVGYKGYGASGPTQCTKLKVYRPKTCSIYKDAHKYENPPRPCTGHQKTRFITQKEVTPMQLALCWDVIPENPADEPRRTIHIDGTNSSGGPAVFTMVQSPKPPEDKDIKPLSRSPSAQRLNTASIFTKMDHDEDKHKPRKNVPDWDVSTVARTKSAWPQHKKDDEICNHVKEMRITDSDNNNNYTQKNEISDSRRSSKTEIHSISENHNGSQHSRNSNESTHSVDSKLSIRRNYQSSPNLSVIGDKSNISSKSEKKQSNSNKLLGRPCMACETKSGDPKKSISRPKSEYKMAFKAGKPNSSASFDSTNSSTGTGSGSSKVTIQVPKQRDPYSKKNYRIGTLAPPFSLRTGKRGLDYPEHWRLASVYQHSYKPLQARKRPLLASVYL